MSRLALVLSVSLCLGVAAVPKVPAQPPGQPKGPAVAPPPHVAWTMYGGTPSRNMVNLFDRDVLRQFTPAKGLGLLWKADLGSRSYSQPIVAGGKVFVGTNNEKPRNKRDRKKPDKDNPAGEPIDKSVMMCFDADTGKFLWQAVHDKLPSNTLDWPGVGVGSIPTVVGDRLYYVSNQCRVVCLDVNGFADGNQGTQTEKYKDATDADFIWEYDMIGELKVFPHNLATGCPLIVGDLLFVQTSNGVDESHINLPSPDAPSFICLNKNTGKLVWKDNSPGNNVMHGQWASPCYLEGPVPQVIFPGGDGWLRAFDPPTGKLLWKFDCNPKDTVYELGGTGTRNDFIAAPVVYDGRVYIGVGQDPEHSTGIANFYCMDPNGRGDVSKHLETRERVKVKGDDGKVKEVVRIGEKPNPNSREVWRYGWEETRQWAPRDFKFGRTMSTACVVDGLVYAAELHGFLHCLDAKTGQQYWEYDTKSTIWGSPYYVDGKVLLATDAGDLWVFRHDRKPETIDGIEAAKGAPDRKAARVIQKAKRREVEDKYLMFKIEFDEAIRGTPSVADGVLYVATENRLYAFKKPTPDE